MLKRAPVTKAILIIIAIVYVPEFFIPQQMFEAFALVRGTLARHEYWRLVTAMFLHAPPLEESWGWLHWAANSWAILQVGALYEVLFGSKRFTLVYFVSGICASIASSMHINGFGVGASGAVFGILGALVLSVWRSPQYRHQPWTRSLIGQLLFWIAFNLYFGYRVKVIDNVAHVGGLVAGLILGFIPHRVPPPSPSSTVIDVQPYDEGGSF